MDSFNNEQLMESFSGSPVLRQREVNRDGLSSPQEGAVAYELHDLRWRREDAVHVAACWTFLFTNSLSVPHRKMPSLVSQMVK